MYFKREHVEQAKRMKIKLKTESSFEKPETNTGNDFYYDEIKDRQKFLNFLNNIGFLKIDRK